MEIITSTQNPKVKLTHALQNRARARRKEGKIALEGVRLVEDAWANGTSPEFILYTDDLPRSMTAPELEAYPVTPDIMRHLSDTETPPGIIGVFPKPQVTFSVSAERVLILDAVRDPGNLGTIIRTAAGAGVDTILLAPGCVDPYNPKVLRSGMGAHFRLPVLELDWGEIENRLQVDAVYLADGYAETAYDAVDWIGSWALIIGSEAHGAGDAARQLMTTPISIPMARATESLNAAMATAVILFEGARQRRV
jgi:TrmH family RNA methyltransferase